MANLTDPRIVNWSDQRVRRLADQTEIFLATLLAYQADYVAQGIGALITAGGGTNLVGDSSVVPGPSGQIDGRQQVTGNAIGPNLKAAVDQMVTAMNTTLVTGVGTTVKAIVDGIQVNGTPR